jgi:hypothetical protein
VRREGSSKFAVNNRWGNFWSLGGSCRVSNEEFMKFDWLNDLNIRVGYGVTGNEGFDADYATVMYGTDDWYTLPNGSWDKSYGIKSNINTELGWEEKHEWNIGLDYSFFDNRLYGKLDFYSRNVEDLIYNVGVPQRQMCITTYGTDLALQEAPTASTNCPKHTPPMRTSQERCLPATTFWKTAHSSKFKM